MDKPLLYKLPSLQAPRRLLHYARAAIYVHDKLWRDYWYVLGAVHYLFLSCFMVYNGIGGKINWRILIIIALPTIFSLTRVGFYALSRFPKLLGKVLLTLREHFEEGLEETKSPLQMKEAQRAAYAKVSEGRYVG